MANILAIDSSTEACSVALSYQGETFQLFKHEPRKHAELLLPMVDQLLNQAGTKLDSLDAIACCAGPGAFTGLRIAISIAQGLAYANRLPCIAVSSLEILAFQAFKEFDCNVSIAALDARMSEVYFSIFNKSENNLTDEIYPSEVIAPEAILLDQTCLDSFSDAKVCLVGNGWQNYTFSDSVNSVNGEQLDILFPRADMMLPLAQRDYQLEKLCKPEFLQPVYLRNKVAKKKSEQK